jgi:hypothetical protein
MLSPRALGEVPGVGIKNPVGMGREMGGTGFLAKECGGRELIPIAGVGGDTCGIIGTAKFSWLLLF